MKVLLSPAKKLDFETPVEFGDQTEPTLLKKTNKLATELKNLKAHEVGTLMKLSAKLSELNFSRFQNFKKKYNTDLSKQAAFAFNGDTYTGLDIQSFSKPEIKLAQKNIRILSGLYGLLKPMDLIQPYRLEMGTKFNFQKYKNLYEFWGSDITDLLNSELGVKDILVNCASNEYFSAVSPEDIKCSVVTPVFKELRNGEYKIISFSAKKARGMMARFIIQNKVDTIAGLEEFNLADYKLNKKLSSTLSPTFTR